MKKHPQFSYPFIIVVHLFIALAVFALPFLSKIYAIIIPFAGLLYVFKTKNKNNEVLLVAAYMVGMEVLLRMTGGNFNNEYVKVSVIFFMLLGMIYSGFSMNSFVYSVFLIFLIPGILITSLSDDLLIDIKKVLFFNLSGPVCLGITAIYTLKRNISFTDMQNIVLAMGLPIITTTAYLFLYNPSVEAVVTGTQSNFETSGGFGPNQVSTILGLGMFVFFTQLILFSKSKKMWFLNGGILLLISYRAIVTFSRGGVITGVVMIIALIILLYYYSNVKTKLKLSVIMILTAMLALAVWSYSSLQTSGLIDKRYANEDAAGRVKKDKLGGREALMSAELNLFFTNPVTGVGAGLGKQYRKKMGHIEDAATHNEITRMLAEHGLFGLFGLLILFLTPFVIYLNNRQHFYFLSFYFFWLLTINHAAMRTAAPAFVYALSLLTINNMKTNRIENKENSTY